MVRFQFFILLPQNALYFIVGATEGFLLAFGVVVGKGIGSGDHDADLRFDVPLEL